MRNGIRIALIASILIGGFLTGCSVNNESTGIESSSFEAEIKMLESNQKAEPQMKKLISDYIMALYSAPIEEYQISNETSEIPVVIKPFIASRTLKEGNLNKEAGISYPRYVSLNGGTIVDFRIIGEQEKDKETQIESSFLEERNNRSLYYVKVNLLARTISESEFESSFILNPVTNTYKKNPESGTLNTDEIRVQGQFDIEIIKDGNEYRIFRAVETTYKQGAKNRMSRYNNDFILPLAYLDLTKVDNKDYRNQKDGAVFEKERNIISSFFNNIVIQDNERRNLLAGSWGESRGSFERWVDLIGIQLDADKKEILAIGEDYKEKFPKEALLLYGNINKIQLNGDYSITPHPAYSQMKKWYIVSFKASVEKLNGILGYTQNYNFDYLVKMVEIDTQPLIYSLKMNQMSKE